MARPLWSGSLTFGLVTIPVQLHTALQDNDIHFHLVTPDGKCRLRRKLVCPDTGKEYDFSQTARGLEVAPGKMVVVDAEELDALQPESGDTFEVDKFVALEDIDPVYFDRPYQLRPGKSGAKSFNLLRAAIEKSGKVGLGSFIMREQQYIAVVRPYQGGLALHTIRFADQIRPVERAPVSKVNEKEIQLGMQLIDSLTAEFEPEKYRDTYQEGLKKLVQKRAKGTKVEKIKKAVESDKSDNVVDIMRRLKESLEGKQSSKKKGKSKSSGTRKAA